MLSVKQLFFFILCSLGLIFWILQSIPHIFQYMDGSKITRRKSFSADVLEFPTLIVCNKLPFSQAGLNSFGSVFQQDLVLNYLQNWFAPALSGSIESEDLSTNDQSGAEVVISQLLPANGSFKPRLEQILLRCQDFVSSCSWAGELESGFDCCKQVEPFLATLDGICWVFKNRSLVQNASTIPRNNVLQITFQISRNSFFSNLHPFHPGIDVFLYPSEFDDRLRIATELTTPHHLIDKKSLRLLVRKQIESDSTRTKCADVISRGKNGVENSYALCITEQSIAACSCVPLFVVLWTLQNDIETSFLRRFNTSTICTVSEFNKCTSSFMTFAKPDFLSYYFLNSNIRLKQAIDQCQNYKPPQCQISTFESESQEKELPSEYRNTQDFVTRLSVAYSSLQVTEVSTVYELDLVKLLTIFGYNFAMWFAIAHLIWSIFSCEAINSLAFSKAGKVKPRESMVPAVSNGISTRRSQLPPLENSPENIETISVEERRNLGARDR